MFYENYSEEKKKLFFNYKYKLVCSKNYRRLDGKTQLFSSSKGDHFRNRMIHTSEVREIAVRISESLNEKFAHKVVNIDLVECIALSHDFGHTPFGHVGERTLQKIVSKEDDLGGLFCKDNGKRKIFFKHNINSMRLLVEEFSRDIPWEILDGVLKHSKLYYEENQDNGVSTLINGTEYDKIYYTYKDSINPLTIEGQIVAIADEIAQRYSDFEDTFRAKNINVLKKQIELVEITLSGYSEDDCVKFIDKIIIALIEGILKQSIENINKYNADNIPEENKQDYLSKNIIIDYDETAKNINKSIDDLIKDCIFDIDELRIEDERNTHIIRQLFKAYYNNCFQITGEYFTKFTQKLITLKNKLDFNFCTKKKYKDLLSISFEKRDAKYKINKKSFGKFINELKKVEFDNCICDDNLLKLYHEYIRLITFYISSMTDKYALDSYKFLYGA